MSCTRIYENDMVVVELCVKIQCTQWIPLVLSSYFSCTHMCLPHHLSNYCTSPPIHLLSTWLPTSPPTSPDACTHLNLPTHIIMPLFLFIIFCCIYLSYSSSRSYYSSEQPQEYWVKELFLTESDKLRITKRRWMDAKVVHAAQTLLKGAYPHIKGLQDSLLAQTLEFDICKGIKVCASTQCVRI